MAVVVARPADETRSYVMTRAHGLRLIVYDATQRQRPSRALGYSWQYGAHLYRALRRVDAAHGADSFANALGWLARHEPTRPIAELQFWGHGKWGKIFIANEMLDRSVLRERHQHFKALQGVRERLAPDALLWFRTCETLGARSGQDFASALADATGARVAGHTYVIGFFQSGLHCLRPGAAPHWAADEGLAKGHPAEPVAALSSTPYAPNTITCLTGTIPTGF